MRVGEFFPVECDAGAGRIGGHGQVVFDLKRARCVLIDWEAVDFKPARVALR